jgi:hypothetical protein
MADHTVLALRAKDGQMLSNNFCFQKFFTTSFRLDNESVNV